MSSSVSEIQNTATEIKIPETKSPNSEAPVEASSPLSDKRIPNESGPEASDQSKKGSDSERKSFIASEKCVEDAEKNKEDIVDKCFEVTSLLKKCMEQHSDYYHPILQAEKVAKDEAVMELDDSQKIHSASTREEPTHSRKTDNMSSSILEIQNTMTKIEIPETKSPESEAPAEASSPSSDKRISKESGSGAFD
ncbi:uncharacterized protein LOC131143979 [Malania oleifera]|uniref:uncharacterized protein LOC131143979 n=1 Tax=Malania oleifera TaxID=397392 RepID=UPI0025ADA40A|nr:uncharacterized protein LOC131143979 [Malania oleifera]